ncbi:DUF547 domain-containing protein [Flavobacterium sp. J27]|uniref:DUF547 domain-containing protein n=1 Tax=Flavobacterium sp. J27 TaxID=2060419 RepID=UPI00102F940E|nr:DUF547 domain-containing protein [Flavobacterium sp. J27]
MKKYIILLFFFSVPIFSQNFDYKEYGLLLSKHVSNKGNVNYSLLQSNVMDLNKVVRQFEMNYPTSKWSRNEILAYYINAYNVYTLKKIIDNYPVKSIKDINNAWDDKFITLGSKKISLTYIEHNILRKMNEPRIHFAINCASYSCPILANVPYLPKTLDNQLETAAKKFINDSTKNILSVNEIKISEIFNWFSKDFKTQNNSLITYLNQFADIKINENAKIRYLEYNWNLNE